MIKVSASWFCSQQSANFQEVVTATGRLDSLSWSPLVSPTSMDPWRRTCHGILHQEVQRSPARRKRCLAARLGDGTLDHGRIWQHVGVKDTDFAMRIFIRGWGCIGMYVHTYVCVNAYICLHMHVHNRKFLHEAGQERVFFLPAQLTGQEGTIQTFQMGVSPVRGPQIIPK